MPMDALALYRAGRWCQRHRIPVLPRLMYRLIFLIFNSVIPMSVEIGEGTTLGYGGLGIVLHARCRIGANVLIAQQVTIGGRWPREGVPVIEDGVSIGAGAKILGPIRVGAGSRVGANAVVLKDVPPRAVVAGVPAKIIHSDTPVQVS